MNHFYGNIELDDPEKLAPALRKMSGESRITIREADFNRVEDALPEGIVLEWTRREGRFDLEIDVRSRGHFLHETQARWSRALAKEMGGPFLFSDCSAFPFSYYMADPDGSIWYVVVKIGDEDIFDLLSDDPNDPDGFPPKLAFRADEELPLRSPDKPLHWTHGETSCDQTVAGKPCLIFNMTCPKISRKLLTR